MRYREILEGVEIDTKIKLAAYAITVAEAYDAAPTSDGSSAWDALNRHNVEVLFKRLSSTIKIEFVEDDPYARYTDDPKMMVRYMLYDMLINKRLQVYSGHSETHPKFTAQENIIFRTVHDYYTHAKLMRAFKAGLEDILRGRARPPSQEELADLLPKIDLAKKGNIGHAFSLRGEYNAYMTHTRIAPKAATPALFTEIVGQVSYKVVCGDFPTQKASVLHGFDFARVGRCIPGSAAEGRMMEVASLIMQGEQEVSTRIAAMPVVDVAKLFIEIGK